MTRISAQMKRIRKEARQDHRIDRIRKPEEPWLLILLIL
jgi:hypothetical protein